VSSLPLQKCQTSVKFFFTLICINKRCVVNIGKVTYNTDVHINDCTLPVVSGPIVGERGGTAFPFCFWWGNAVPLAYTTAVAFRLSLVIVFTALLFKVNSILKVTPHAIKQQIEVLVRLMSVVNLSIII